MKARISLFVLLVVFLFSMVSYAQPGPPPPQKGELLKQLKERLELSSSQVKKIETILSESQKRLEEFRPERNNGERPPMEKMEELVKKQDSEIAKVLDEEQQKEFAKMKRERDMKRPPMGDRPEPPRN